MNRPTVWTISGSDSSGLSGMQADLASFAALEVRACSAVTAVTAQRAGRFELARIVEPEMLEAQLQTLAAAHSPAAIKVGMVGSSANARVILKVIDGIAAPIVWDPVILSTSGTSLVEPEALEILTRELLPRARVITPNRLEARILGGESMNRGVSTVVLKGGHDYGKYSSDSCRECRGEVDWIHVERKMGLRPRGTGCTFSSAIAAGLAHGLCAIDAICQAKTFVSYALRTGTEAGDGMWSLGRAGWPYELRPDDLPWITKKADGERRAFPSIGREELAFYPIVDRASWISRLIPSGLSAVQLRIKDLSGWELSREIDDAVRICRGNGVKLFVNDYWKEALRSGAYGVHLGQEDLETCEGLDALERAGIRLGVSTHGWAEICRAKAMGPSYIAVGPIFPTESKKMNVAPQGESGMRFWRRLIDEPMIGIGGITLERARMLRKAGADGIAMISDISRADSPEIRAQDWIKLSRMLNTE